jgi:hypothetical protein
MIDAIAQAIFDGRQSRGDVLARSWNDAPTEVIDEHHAMAEDAVRQLALELEGELDG